MRKRWRHHTRFKLNLQCAITYCSFKRGSCKCPIGLHSKFRTNALFIFLFTLFISHYIGNNFVTLIDINVHAFGHSACFFPLSFSIKFFKAPAFWFLASPGSYLSQVVSDWLSLFLFFISWKNNNSERDSTDIIILVVVGWTSLWIEFELLKLHVIALGVNGP